MPSLQVTTATGSSSSQQVNNNNQQKMDTTTIKIPALTTAPRLAADGVIYPAAALANLPQVSQD